MANRHLRLLYSFAGLVFLIGSVMLWRQKMIYLDVVVSKEAQSLLFASKNNEADATREESPVQHACNNLPTSLPLLIRALKDRSDDSGLRSIREGGMEFPGLTEDLLSRAFQNKRIVLLGDSSLKYLTSWLQVLLHDNCNNGTSTRTAEIKSWSNFTLHEANNLLQEKASGCTPSVDLHGKRVPGRHVKPTKKGTTHIEWLGLSGLPTGTEKEMLLHKAWADAAKQRPEVLVVNMGLHWQHFIGQHGLNRDWEDIHNWIFYEEQWLQQAVNKSLAMGTKILLFKTTNFICAERFHDKLARGHLMYSTNDEAKLQKTLQECEIQTAGLVPEANQVSKEQISRFCRHGLFNDHGSSYLNQRMYRFIEQLPDFSNLKVGIYNDHDVESCDYTGDYDGRHYMDLNLLRLRLLGNILACANDDVDDSTVNPPITFQQQMKQYARLSTTTASVLEDRN